MKKMFIKLVSFLFMIGALSSSAIAIDKLHFVVPGGAGGGWDGCCLLYTSPSPRDRSLSRMPSSA